MPFSATIQRDPDLQYVRASGLLTLGELRRQIAAAPGLPGYYPGIPTLVDLRRLRGASLGLADMMGLRDRLIERHGDTPAPLRMALFAESETAFGIARIFETVCADTAVLDVRIFETLGEALGFLDLTVPDIAGLMSDETASRCA